MQVTTVGLDLAKNIFQVHGVTKTGDVAFNRPLRRAQVLAFFQRLPPCLVGIEACASSHHWARELSNLGHTVRLMPPMYVKPYVKRGKSDAVDAEAICEAVTRPTMRFVEIKSEELDAGAIDQKVQRAIGAKIPDLDGQGLLSAAQGAEVGHGPVHPRQMQYTRHNSRSLSQRELEAARGSVRSGLNWSAGPIQRRPSPLTERQNWMAASEKTGGRPGLPSCGASQAISRSTQINIEPRLRNARL